MLLLLSFDYHCQEILNKEDAISGKYNPEEHQKTQGRKASKAYAGPKSTVAARQAGKSKAQEQEGAPPVLWVDQVPVLARIIQLVSENARKGKIILVVD